MEQIDFTLIASKIEDFLSKPKYKAKIDELVEFWPKKRSLLIEFRDLDRFDPEIADLLIEYPEEVLELMKQAVISIASPLPIEKEFEPHVRVFGLPEAYRFLIRDVGSVHIGKLIEVEGVVTKVAEARPKIKVATFECVKCARIYRVEQKEDRLTEPLPCECGSRIFKLLEEKSKFVDVQKIQIQEPLEKIKGGVEAQHLDLWLEDDLVNLVKPGDKVVATGIIRIERQKGGKSTLYLKRMKTVFIERIEKEFEEVELEPEDIEKIKELAKDPKIFERITASIAPSIYGHKEVKQALALQLFGGTDGKVLPDGRRIRSDIHILLIGDPGVAKSELLRFVDRLAPKSVYVSGKSVTGAGLTATAERDEFGEGGWTLKAGALVLASGGIAAIDEFDKIRDEEKMALHESMEQQSISIAKAGIVTRFVTKTAILAAANPKMGRFDPNRLPAEQFDIPPTLLSRFDLIFPIRDVLDEKKDRKLARHILRAHRLGAMASRREVSEEEEKEFKGIIAPDLLRKYIAYARKHVKPVLTEEAMKRIEDFYVELRKRGMEEGAVPITPRQIEGIIRLAEASAKLRLSDRVELQDAEVAINLMKFVMKEIFMDRETGRIDVDIIALGKPKSLVDKARVILDIIEELQRQYDGAEEEKIIERAKEHGIEKRDVKRILEDLKRSGEIFQPEHGVWRTVG